jgi:nucleotide-binding universal stress UspA family protein
VRKENAMKPIMLATDGSPSAEQATEAAIELAQSLGAALIVLTVWDIPYTAVGFTAAPVTPELAQFGEDDARKACSEAAAQAEEAGVETRSVVLRGMPIQEICLAAEKFEPRFLVVGSHGWGIVKRAVFGSVSTGVLHHATRPVLVVRAEPVEATVGLNGRTSVRAA